MEIVRIDYRDENVPHLKIVNRGIELYRNCDPVTAIGKFQAMCRERGYNFVITNWSWYSVLAR